MKKKVIIMGAAGRDFHVFNTYFRDNEDYQVLAFTATQIPDIEGRKYPPELAGRLYPGGIHIYGEEELESLVKELEVDQVIFAYSDISHQEVMHKASRALSAGADFRLMGPRSTMLKATKPVVSVCAVRTGAGKSHTSQRVCEILKGMGKRVVAVRHPMPYGDLRKQICQRFASYEDLDRHECTIEEREEYEPHIDTGTVVFAGVDYEKILNEAEKEADVVVWDGGNNDLPFYQPDISIVLVDPLRPGHEVRYHPGETNLRMADVLVINNIENAEPKDVREVRNNISRANPAAVVVDAASPVYVENKELIKGKRVLVVEDGPTPTHGEMSYFYGFIAAQKFGAGEIIDPRPFAVGSLKETYRKYSHISNILPAMGYGKEQVAELEKTINSADCDVVVLGTPIDLSRIAKINKPTVRVRYSLQEIGHPRLEDILRDKLPN